MSRNKVETEVAATVGVIAGAGMLFAALGAWLYDGWLRSPWGDDGLTHLEIVEMLPYFFWFALSGGVLLSRHAVAKIVCDRRALCWTVAGALFGHVLFGLVATELLPPENRLDRLSHSTVQAAVHVITWLGVLMGAAVGAALARIVGARFQ